MTSSKIEKQGRGPRTRSSDFVNRSGQKTRKLIRTAASRVFARKGYVDASLRDIALEADLPISSLGYHFGSKERLFIETVRSHLPTQALLEELFEPLLKLKASASPQAVSDAMYQSVLRHLLCLYGPEKLPNFNGLLLRVLVDGHHEAHIMVLECFALIQHKVSPVLERFCPKRAERDMEIWFSLLWAQLLYPVTTRQLRLLNMGWSEFPMEWLRHLSHRIAWYQCLPLGLPEPSGRTEMPVVDSIKTRAVARAAVSQKTRHRHGSSDRATATVALGAP